MSYVPFVTTGDARAADVIIICDHAANTIPPQVANGCLGLPKADMQRHIAYDIGAAGISEHLGALMDAPVVCSNFSRLVIDPNRGEDDPTLLMRLSDSTIIPGNRYADDAELNHRLNLCYRPYHRELARLVATRSNPALISIHSFTPQYRGRPLRPWHIGILSNHDRRLSEPLLAELYRQPDITTGDNVPYTGFLINDTMDKHALHARLLHTLVEVRQDLITTPQGQNDWAERLAPLLKTAISKARQTNSEDT
jgi:predicted N-formylglutamate amidohydrolase